MFSLQGFLHFCDPMSIRGNIYGRTLLSPKEDGMQMLWIIKDLRINEGQGVMVRIAAAGR